jgi:hypothetical protein
MNLPIKSFQDYDSYYNLIKRLEKPIKWGTNLGLIPETVYRKYFSFNIK